MSAPSPAAPRLSQRTRVLRAIGVVLVLAGCAALLLNRVEGPKLWTALRHADGRLVALAALANLVLNLAVRSERWRLLLLRLAGPGDGSPRPQLARGRLWWLYLAHLAANNLLPARAGEALRVLSLAGPGGLPASGLVAVLLVEKGAETLSMGLVAALLLVGFSPPAALVGTLRWMFALGLFCVLLAFVLVHVSKRGSDVQGRVRAFVRHLLSALRLLHAPGLWGAALVLSWASLAIDVGMIGLCLQAVGVARPVIDWLFVFLAINLAIALPTTPGQVGVMETGAVLALSLLGVGASEGLAFALLYHAAHVLPTTLLGTLAWLTLRRRTADRSQPSDPG